MKECLKTYGVKRETSDLLRNYFHEPYQTVVFNGAYSSEELISSGVPQGSVFGL